MVDVLIILNLGGLVEMILLFAWSSKLTADVFILARRLQEMVALFMLLVLNLARLVTMTPKAMSIMMAMITGWNYSKRMVH